MIRRIGGRVRRAASASLVPLRGAPARLRAVAASFSPLVRSLVQAAGAGLRTDHNTLRVGVDIRPFYEPLTGVGWYLWFLLEELARIPDLDLVYFGDPAITDAGPHLHVALPGGAAPRAVDLRGIPAGAASRRLAAATMAAAAWIDRCDLFFGANYFLPRAISAVATRRVVTVHDLTYARHPELLQDETLADLRREMLREIHRADAVICVSEATRADLLATYEVDPRKVRTILSGPPPSRPAATPRLHLPDRYLLFVSTIEPRKNLDALVAAFELLRDGGYPGELVVAGKVGWKSDSTLRRIETSRWSAAIRRLDYVDRDQLPWLYRGAEAFVLPSRYEGFGLPILEAMAEGAPVIAARNSSLPEIGGDAALYFDENDPAQLAALLRRVVDQPSLRATMSERGRANLARFSWMRAAHQTAEVFRRVAGR